MAMCNYFCLTTYLSGGYLLVPKYSLTPPGLEPVLAGPLSRLVNFVSYLFAPVGRLCYLGMSGFGLLLLMANMLLPSLPIVLLLPPYAPSFLATAVGASTGDCLNLYSSFFLFSISLGYLNLGSPLVNCASANLILT